MKKKKKSKKYVKRKFALLIEKSGIAIDSKKVSKTIFNVAVIINLLVTGYLLYKFATGGEYTIAYILVVMAFMWILIFGGSLLFLWLMFYLLIDLRIYQRRIGVEDVFPDFLQLTSANIRAGMPIDQALWHAIRPNFGVLAKEMEDVAKETMSGTDLEDALMEFANRYDSNLLKRSISLLIEGLDAGGEVGELLDRISTNIQESKMMKKEMAASVTTYAIFIGFASVVAAPFLLALSSQLLVIIKQIVSSIDVDASNKMALGISKVSVKYSDFKIFAVLTLTITNALSAAIVATIKKGNIKGGIKYFPTFIVSTLALFFILEWAMGIMMSGFF